MPRREPMAAHAPSREIPMRPWTVLAQDPSVRGPGGRALTTRVWVPAERLERGPQGHRVQVIDYNASTDRYHAPAKGDPTKDRFEKVTDPEQFVRDARFHAQNVYAIAMATLTEFQAALGRQVPWAFLRGHQIKIAPHAFAEANAYYTREAQSLAFGYFAGRRGRTVYTCLSHDIVAHETTHALLDGIRGGFLRPSSVDQAAFHEGYADIIALLSVFSSSELIEHTLREVPGATRNLIPSRAVTVEQLRRSILASLAEEMGSELAEVRGAPLRRSTDLTPSIRYLKQHEFQEPHRRGEILVAATLNVFLAVWGKRLDPLGRERGIALNRTLVADEGATAARQLLRIAIRALDYCPPIDLSFGNYLSALLTADTELYPDDSKYCYRQYLKDTFAAYGIEPTARRKDGSGTWEAPLTPVSFTGTHFEPLQRDPEALFRFIWENQRALEIEPEAYTRVTSVRPCVRLSNDQFVLRETVAEYIQTLTVRASELRRWDIRKPDAMPDSMNVTLYGGGTLIFNEFGALKYHIGKGVRKPAQTSRLQCLWDRGFFQHEEGDATDFAALHRQRSHPRGVPPTEQW